MPTPHHHRLPWHHSRLPQRRRHTITASLGATSLDVVPSPPSTSTPRHHHLPRCHAVASLSTYVAPSSPPLVQHPLMMCYYLPQRRCHTVAASLDAVPSPPSMPTLPPSTIDSLDFTLFYAICWYCFGCDCIIYWINQVNDDMRCSETRT
jgi:hypothetical protein